MIENGCSTDALMMLAESVRDCPRPTCVTCRQAAVDVLERAEPVVTVCRVGGRAYRLTRNQVAQLIGAACEVIGDWNPDVLLDEIAEMQMDKSVSTLADCLREAEVRQ